MKLVLQKKMREVQTLNEDLNQTNAKFDRLLTATKALKIENNRLKEQVDPSNFTSFFFICC